MNYNLETEIHDLMDLLNFTLGKDFTDKWRFKYGERLIKLFQIKILDSLRNAKVIKLKTLYKFFTKDSGFSDEVARNFLQDIDFSLYFPIITGTKDDLKETLE